MKCENQQRSYGCNTEEMISAQTWSTQLNTPGPVMSTTHPIQHSYNKSFNKGNKIKATFISGT